MPETPVTPPTPDAGKPAAPVTPPQIYKLKVNGQDRDYTIDQLMQSASKADGLEARVKDADQLEKAWAGFLTQSLEDPTALFTHPSMRDKFNKKVLKEKLGRWYYDTFIVPDQMDPKERMAKEAADRAELAERQLQEFRQKDESSRQQQAVQNYWNDYRSKIGEAMKTEGLPQHESVVQRTARYLYLALRSNQKMEVADAVKMVKKDLLDETIARFNSLDEEGLSNYLPREVMEKINKAFLKQFKKEESAKAKEKSDNAPSPVRRPAGRRAESLDKTRNVEKTLRDMARGKF